MVNEMPFIIKWALRQDAAPCLPAITAVPVAAPCLQTQPSKPSLSHGLTGFEA